MKKTKTAACLFLAMIIILTSPGVSFGGNNERSSKEGEIWTAEELRGMKNDPSGTYTLMTDIDMKGESWEPFAFSGTLDGNGHSITNISIKGVPEDKKEVTDANVFAKGTSYTAVCDGFFTILENAKILDLGLWGIEIECGGEDCMEPVFLGLLAGYAYNTSIENVQIYGAARLITSGGIFGDENYANQCMGIAGVFGFTGASTIENCHVECDLTCNDTEIGHHDEQFMGGAYGFGYADIINTYVYIQGWDSDHGYVHDGGLIGCFMYYDSDKTDYEPVSITGNYVGGQITFYEDNEDTRAYCEPIAGEIMDWDFTQENNEKDFERNQVYTYGVDLYSHCTCKDNQMTVFDVSASAGKPGYKLEVCDNCGYKKKSDFTAPLPGVFTDNQIHNWQKPYEGCADILVLSSHADDEQLFFAGSLTYYAQVRHLAVQVVYGTDHIGEPYRYEERENGLWGVGITHELDSSGWYDEYADTKEEAVEHLINRGYISSEDDVVDWVKEMLLKYRPQVVVTHDINGEYGHGFHMLMSWAVSECAKKYGDEMPFLKKVYLHLGDENKLTLTPIDERFGELDGLTPFQVAQKYGFSEHYSQQQWWFNEWLYYGYTYDEPESDVPITKASSIKTYSPLYFGLVYGDPSLDESHSDMFEGLTSYEEQRLAEEERVRREQQAEEEKALQEEKNRIALERRKKITIIIFSLIALFVFTIVILRIYNKSKKRRKKR